MQRMLHRTFDGLFPRREPSLLDENAAQIARDVDLRRGVLTPILGRAPDSAVEGYDCGSTARSSYLYRYKDWTLTMGTVGELTQQDWIDLASTGKFTLTIDGTAYQVNPDFTEATFGWVSIAAAIQDAIQAATGGFERCEWVGTANEEHFVFYACAAMVALTAPLTGTDISVSGWLNGRAATPATTEGKKWLSWAGDVNVVVGPVNDDPYNRVYYTGDGVPKMRLRMAGVDYARTMAVEKPATPPTADNAEPYTPPTDEVERTSFPITSGRIVVRSGTGWQGTVLKIIPISFERLGDTLVVAQGSVSYHALGFHVDVQFLVNDKWEDCQAENGQSIDIVDPSGAYTMRFDFTAVTWRWHWTTVGTSVTLKYGGGIKLIYGGGVQVPDDSVAVSYCCSFVTDVGEEGPPSDASEVYLAEAATDIDITDLPQPVDTNRGISLIRLYRAAGGAFRWLADIAVGTTTYTDTTPDDDSDLGEALNEDTTNPPDDLTGIVACAGGWFAAFRGREFLASQASIPTSWPESYRMTVQAQIVALASIGSDTFVMTRGRPVVMVGSDPAALTAVNIESDQSCVSAAGVVLLGQTVLYPSPDGLVAMYAGAAKVVTSEWYRREDWQALVPGEIRAAGHDGRYYALLAGLETPSMLILDFSESVDRVTTAEAANILGISADLETDALYVIETDELCQWQGGADALQLDWQGRDWLFPAPMSYCVMRVLAAAYVVPEEAVPPDPAPPDTRPYVTLYADGASVFTRRITGPEAFKLPRMRPERRWSLRVQSMVEVTEITLATSLEALRN